jgi:hypothetical protein
VQITIRAMPGLPSLRSPRVFGVLRRAIARAIAITRDRSRRRD